MLVILVVCFSRYFNINVLLSSHFCHTQSKTSCHLTFSVTIFDRFMLSHQSENPISLNSLIGHVVDPCLPFKKAVITSINRSVLILFLFGKAITGFFHYLLTLQLKQPSLTNLRPPKLKNSLTPRCKLID